MQIYKIYDNNGKTADRYSILVLPFHYGIETIEGKYQIDCLSVSDDPTHPQYGVSTWGYAIDDKHLGKEIKLEQLPENVQEHVLFRLSK
ncbi:MAG: hypothetical protein IPM48_15085 [Saprospiraceae bacterium]|nr:hypothetical protein [Saprospiraceae bacterium]MBK9272907.1 hypothetical protein [Saprospiraceae bacterium]